MRIPKSLKSEYDACIEFIRNERHKEDFTCTAISQFTFLNYVQTSRQFSKYCYEIGDIAIHCFVRDVFVLRVEEEFRDEELYREK